jgi:hypothetical protein
MPVYWSSTGDGYSYGDYSAGTYTSSVDVPLSGTYTMEGTDPTLTPGTTVVSVSFNGNQYDGGVYQGYVTVGGTDYPIYEVAPGPTGYYTAGTALTSGTSLPVTAGIIPFCFLTGTHISTPTGEVLVEDLNIGDIISTADGGVRKVIWIGKQTLSSIFTPAKNLPVEITIGALGNNLPTRPLRVSPGHSLLVGGVFPIASALVNDVTVRQLTKEELPDTFTYYHIEVEDHALILAEGVPAETFLDASSRRQFSNWSEYVELYGEEEREVPRSDLHYQRILKFDNLPQELKETIGYPLSYDEMKVA